MSRITDETRREIMALHQQGLGYRKIGRQVGVSATSVHRVVVPGYAERLRITSRENHRSKKGVCVDCGAVTSYYGAPGKIVSDRCPRCANRASARKKRGTGSRGTKILAHLENGPASFSELVAAVGCPANQLGATLGGMRKHGLIIRVRWGVYALPQDELANQRRSA